MPRGILRAFNLGPRPHRAAHVKAEVLRCPTSWWAEPLTREQFDQKARERANEMRLRGLKYSAEVYAW